MTSRATIVVAVDGSEANQTAVAWAADAARQDNMSMDLVHVVNDSLRLSPYFTTEEIERDAQHILEAARTQVGSLAPEVKMTTRCLFGHAARTLVELAEGSTLLVLGRRGHGSFARLLLGSVSASAAGQSTIPTAVIPKTWDVNAYRRAPIVVGVDGTSCSDSALRYAVELAARRQVELRVVHVWGGDPNYSWDPELVRADFARWREDATELVTTVAEPWRRKYPELVMSAVVHQGHIVGSLVSESESAQLVVVGGHRTGRLHAGLTGSTAYGVLHHAESPVVVVRESE